MGPRLEAQRSVKQGRFRDLLSGLLADGITKPGLWGRANLSRSESRHEQKHILSDSHGELVSAKTEVPLFWERPIAQIRDWCKTRRQAS